MRQSQSNVLDVTRAVKALIPTLQADMPEGVVVEVSSDHSVFIERSVREVYQTLWEAAVLVVLMIFLFLRDWRATLVPLVAIPVSVIGTFAVMSWLGFTINTLTLLALVLAVGLVVDDAIVMLEISMPDREGESPFTRHLRCTAGCVRNYRHDAHAGRGCFCRGVQSGRRDVFSTNWPTLAIAVSCRRSSR